MTKLEDFLSLPNVADLRESVKFRYKEKDYEFIVSAITERQLKDYQKMSTRTTKNGPEIDESKVRAFILDNHIVEPCFSSADFLTKAGVARASDFLASKFPAGYLSDVVAKILAFSGFDNGDINEDIEDAKN